MDRLPFVCSGGPRCKCPPEARIANWRMFDVPLTMSVSAPTESAARAYVDQWLESDRCSLYGQGETNEPAYQHDHIFRDGEPRVCDCVGH